MVRPSVYRRGRRDYRQVEAVYEDPAAVVPYQPPPSPAWFLTMYVRDVWRRLPVIKAAATSTFGAILKIDSTKQVRKLHCLNESSIEETR